LSVSRPRRGSGRRSRLLVAHELDYAIADRTAISVPIQPAARSTTQPQPATLSSRCMVRLPSLPDAGDMPTQPEISKPLPLTRAASRTPNSLKEISSRHLALDGLEVLDGRGTAEVEEVVAHAAIAGTATLAPNKVSELVLDADPLA
jgi:hypothetical protein